jgi:hypothetical protein
MAADQGFRVQSLSNSQIRMKYEIPLMPAFCRTHGILQVSSFKHHLIRRFPFARVSLP